MERHTRFNTNPDDLAGISPATGARRGGSSAATGALSPEVGSGGDVARIPAPAAARALAEAQALLAELKAGQVIVENKLAEDRRQDPIRQITGNSALETAISSTEELIRRLQTAAAGAEAAQSATVHERV